MLIIEMKGILKSVTEKDCIELSVFGEKIGKCNFPIMCLKTDIDFLFLFG